MQEETIEEIKVSELKADLKLMKAEWEGLVSEDKGYDAKEDLFLAAMANLEDELKPLQPNQILEKLEIRQKARIFAHMQMLGTLLDQFDSEEDEFEEEESEEE